MWLIRPSLHVCMYVYNVCVHMKDFTATGTFLDSFALASETILEIMGDNTWLLINHNGKH